MAVVGGSAAVDPRGTILKRRILVVAGSDSSGGA
jgi:hypothetical protein